MIDTFTLTETFAFGDEYSWRLKDGQIRFRGKGSYSQLVNRRISTTAEQREDFWHALNLLEVWNWRDDYDPQDADASVDDGSCWTFMVVKGDQQFLARGVNAYPSFADPQKTSLDPSRFALLLASFYCCFNIDYYIEHAKHRKEIKPEQSP